MSNRITRIQKQLPISHCISKEMVFCGDSRVIDSYMKSASSVSPSQQINRWADIVANAFGSYHNQSLSGDGKALCNSYLPLGSKNHTTQNGDYGGQIIISTNDTNDYWWDSEATVWKSIGGSTFSGINKDTDWAAMLTDADINIVVLADSGTNDYGEWSSRSALAKGAFGSPKMFYQRMKQMIVEVLDAGKTPIIMTGMDAFDLTFHGKESDYFQTGTYAAKARQLAIEYNITYVDGSAVLAAECALGRPDINARNANIKPDAYTVGEWTDIVNSTPNPETGVNYLYPFTDAYRDSNGAVMVDETFDKYHDGSTGRTPDATRAYWQNKHHNFWGQLVLSKEFLDIINEYRI